MIANPGTGLEGLIISGPSNQFHAGITGVITVDVTDKTAQRILGQSPMTTVFTLGDNAGTVAVNSTTSPWELTFNVERAGLWTLSITAGLLTHVVGSPFSVRVPQPET